MRVQIRQWISIVLLGLFTIHMFSSCETHDVPYTEGKTTVPKENTPYSIEYHSFEEYEEILDLVQKRDSNYQLLCHNAVGSHYIETDTSFQTILESSNASVLTEVMWLDEEVLYTCAREATGELNIYHIFKGDKIVCSLPDLGDMKPQQLIIHDGVAYSYFSHLTENAILINDRILDIPSETADGVRYELSGITLFKNQVFALLLEYRVSGEESTDYKTYFVPLDASSDKVEATGTVVPCGVGHGLVAANENELYFIAGNSLYRYSNENPVIICDLLSLGISNFDNTKFGLLGQGSFYFLQGNTVTVLEKSTDEEAEIQTVVIGIPEKEETLVFNNLTDTIRTFNMMDTPYKVVLKAYGDRESLNLGMLSGEVDIIQHDGNPDIFLNYCMRDMLVSLESVVPELFEEGVLLDNIKDAYRYENSWYYLPLATQVWGITLPASLVESKSDFESMGAFLDFVSAADPILLRASERQGVVNDLVFGYMDNWIDWETRTAYFTGGEFLKVLELCKKCSTHEVASQYNDRDQIGRFYSCSVKSTYTGDDLVKGRKQVVGVAIPVGDLSGMAIHGECYVAKSINGKNSEGADAFLRYALYDKKWPGDITVDDHSEYGLQGAPIKQREAEKYFMLDKAANRKVHQLMWEHHTRADRVFYYGALVDVILEEVNRYFNDDITAEQAAEYIQNRVSIYLAEQG